MDNGLIFPYPCERAHGESVILTALNPAYFMPSGVQGVGGCVGPDLVVAKRWGDAGR
jgi:hypothetical protein